MLRPILPAAVAALLLAGCRADLGGPGPSGGSTRPFYMGFSGFPPRIDQDVAIQALEAWTRRADIAIVHEELPWTDLLAGVAPDTILRREKDGLINYYRAKGLKLVFIADPNDGLARQSEAPRLRALGRSFTEPAVQAVYREWILAFVRRFRPEYVGLVAETNLIRIAAPAPLYQAIVAAAGTTAAAVKALPNPPKLFVSVQVEAAWGKLVGGPYLGIEQDFVDFPFLELLGLSSYPYFGWPDQDQLPTDYYRRPLNGRRVPVMIVEGGWASQSAAGFTTSPATQARYFRRQLALLAETTAIGWLQLAPTDIDLPSFPADIRESIRPFASLGVYDVELRAKPALAVWDSVFALPRK